MPIYEYRCNDCGSDFEYMQRMSDAPKAACESCGGTLERLISRSSFHFKGGGWYKDLYASSKPQGSSANSDANSSTSSAAKDSGTASSGKDSGSANSSKDSGASSSSSNSASVSSAAT